MTAQWLAIAFLAGYCVYLHVGLYRLKSGATYRQVLRAMQDALALAEGHRVRAERAEQRHGQLCEECPHRSRGNGSQPPLRSLGGQS